MTIYQIKKLLICPVIFTMLCVGSLGAAEVTDVTEDQGEVAEYAEVGVTPKLDPTLEFFMALSACKPGSYQERNILSDAYGEVYLTQQITGEVAGYCSVILSTPDRRVMDCQFSQQDLAAFSDQHFLSGMLVNTTVDPTPASINADTLWAEMKNKSCMFAEEEL